MDKKKKSKINSSFYIPPDLKSDLQELANAQERSVSKTIVMLVKEAVFKFKNTK